MLKEEITMQGTIRAARADEVPVLDLGALNSGGDLAPLARQLRHACETIGFFYVANHGIPTPIFDGVFAATRRYFDLPQPQRLTPRLDDPRHHPPPGLRAGSKGELRDRRRPAAHRP